MVNQVLAGAGHQGCGSQDIEKQKRLKERINCVNLARELTN